MWQASSGERLESRHTPKLYWSSSATTRPLSAFEIAFHPLLS